MKVTFIQPYYHNIWESLGIGYIASYCKNNYKGDLDLNFYHANFDDDKEIINGSLDSDIIAFSCTTPSYDHGLRLSKEIKEKNKKIKSVFGGWHTTALKEKSFNEYVDQIVVGEGEKAFLQILNGDKEKIIYGEKLNFIDLPFPDRDLIKNIRTINLCESMNGLRTASFQANRGCPMNCAFCSELVMTGKFNSRTNNIRRRDISDLCNEIEEVTIKYNINYFKFVDATFDSSSDYVISFCKEKFKRGIKTNWESLIHASFVTEEMLFWMAKANCKQINIGCESGSEKILKDIGKGVKIDKIKKVLEWAKNYNIKRRCFFILGMPRENIDDLKMTEKLIDETYPDVVGFTLLCPYPGSSLYDYEKYKNINWAETDEYCNDFWRNDCFTNEELKEWQQYFKLKYENGLCERQKK